MYRFTVPKHMTATAMKKIIPRLRPKTSNSRSSSNRKANTDQNPRRQSVATNTRNQRVDLRAPPVYIPAGSDVSAAQGLSLDARRRYSQGGVSSAYNPYRRYYGRDYWDRQAASADYGRRYVSSAKSSTVNDISENGIPLAFPIGGSRDSGNGIPLSNSIPGSGPRLTAQNIPDRNKYFWRLSGFTECSATCGGGTHCFL